MSPRHMTVTEVGVWLESHNAGLRVHISDGKWEVVIVGSFRQALGESRLGLLDAWLNAANEWEKYS